MICHAAQYHYFATHNAYGFIDFENTDDDGEYTRGHAAVQRKYDIVVIRIEARAFIISSNDDDALSPTRHLS